ncbi:MAG: LysR family transcriptional regulator [Clostridia bacterium]|nr:LysR family transcriptional regulator [Clostridia bacterium]
MNISYDHYRIFYYVAKYKSFTRAAEIMYSNQPNLTRAIKNLEKQLDCTLFERTNKGVVLTEEGAELYEHISAAFKHIRAGEESISLKNSLQNGVLSLGATEIALRCYLLPILGRYHKLYPGIRIKILNISTPQAVRMIDNRLIDLAVVTTPIEPNDKITTITLRELTEVPVCSTEFDAEQDITLKELAGYPIISLGKGSSTYDMYFKLFTEEGLDFSPDIEAATADQILPLVKHGLGVGFVPEEFLDTETGIKRISLSRPLPMREITLVRKKRSSLALPAKELLRLINEQKTTHGK